MKKNIYLINLIILFISPLCADTTASLDKNFMRSFIKHYEFNAQGKYAHEYHPALLKKTASSLDTLENQLKNKQFNLLGRLIICGYEEQAVPSYYTDYKKAFIDDEASKKGKVGWSLRLHNRFGFMTGFLFKDFNYFANHWFENKKNVFEHVDSEDIEIFDDRATIFQQHAFGDAYELIIQAQKNVVKKFKNQDYNGILKELVKFWDCLYRGEIKVRNKQVAGTQDIIFSIENAKHLLRSQLPFYNFFVGPDITYPVEVSYSQNKDVTVHAQDFVKIFAEKLIPQQNKPTVYVFCSFVDGVGKSTLLGNIKNYTEYGSDVTKYDRVDNSSSQLAEVFKLKENVFIADLPAQVSHYSYKPDGFVYVDVGREIEKDQIKELQQFVRDNKENLYDDFKNLVVQIKEKIDTQGYLIEELNYPKAPEKSFIKNLFLLKKEKTNRWVSFNKDGKSYLFNYYNPSQIRILCLLGIVQSEGLKNIESEQMLFFKGIRLPLPYDLFLNDLTEKLKTNGIENVIFVDFISMYPRSSRENIRINYLQQQMALLDESFDSKYSLYRDFVNEAELFSLLKEKDSFNKILGSFRLEALLRLALFKAIIKNKQTTLDGFSLLELTTLIEDELKAISPQDYDYLKEFSVEKLDAESCKLEKIYGLTKAFVNIQQFSFSDALKFSNLLSDFFTYNISNDRLNTLWQDPGNVLGCEQNIDSEKLNKIVQTDKNLTVKAGYNFDFECKDEHLLTPFLRTIRTVWYAALSNLLNATVFEQNSFLIEKEKYFVSPILIKQGSDKRFYLIQRLFDEWQWQGEVPKDTKFEKWFNLSKMDDLCWGGFENYPYRLDWKSLGTNYGLFAFDCNMSATKKFSYYNDKSIITFMVQKYRKEYGQDVVVPTSKLYKKLEESEMWKREWKEMLRNAKQNGKYGEKKQLEKKEKEKKTDDYNWQGVRNKAKVYLGTEEQIPAFKMFIRMLATLEMFVKDPDADIVVRKMNKKDFAAALKLLEKVTLPKYVGILFEQDLFDDYELVEPCPSWEDWE